MSLPVASLIAAALLTTSATLARGAETSADDGLYLSVQDTSAPSARSQDGTLVFLGARKTKILEKQLRSQNNSNVSFSLSLTIPYDAGLSSDRHVLVVAGTVYRQSGSGSSGQTSSSLYFPILGEDNAREVARYLDIPVERFLHPGHRLRVTFTPTKQSFARGEQVTANLEVVNIGTEPVAFIKGGRNRAARDNQYVFAAYLWGQQPVPDIGSSANFGGISTTIVLQPGATFEDTVRLNLWFDFRESGRYEIHGSYLLRFRDPETRSLPVFWTDFASADFTVTIE